MPTEKKSPDAVAAARLALDEASKTRDAAIERVQEATKAHGSGPERDAEIAALELATANEAKAQADLDALLT